MSAELQQFIRDPAVRREHEEWLRLPATQRAILAVEQMNRPFLPMSADPHVGAQCHNIQCGVHHALRQLETLHEISDKAEELYADYGAEQIMEAWGRQLAKPKKGAARK